MSYERVFCGGAAWALKAVDESDAEKVIKGIETYIRTVGATFSELADAAEIDRATFTLFAQRKYPTGWQSFARATDAMLARLYDRLRREADMPVMTPVVRATLGVAKHVMEDGGIGLIQGDSGTGKTEAIRAVALRYPASISVQASTARARMKPMLEDIGRRLGHNYIARNTADTYGAVRERLGRCELLIVDEVHKYIGRDDCLQVLVDLLKETAVPQLWTATGDLQRYLDRKIGNWRDTFDQIRSRISHKLDLSEFGGGAIGVEEIRELARRKFRLTLDGPAARELVTVATLDNEGSLRLVENALKHAKRLATAGKLTTVDRRTIGLAMDRTQSKRTRERARRIATTNNSDAGESTQSPSQEDLRATA